MMKIVFTEMLGIMRAMFHYMLHLFALCKNYFNCIQTPL